MKKMIQQIMTYTFDNDEKKVQRTQKSSFGTLEKAIENSEMFINKTEDWIKGRTTVVRIEIVNKETNETLWTYKA